MPIMQRCIGRLPIGIGALLLTACLHSCEDGPLRSAPSAPPADIRLQRLDQDLFAHSTDSLEARLPLLQERYGAFFTDYCEGMLRIGRPTDPAFAYGLAQFISDESMRALYADSRKDFADVSDMERELAQAFGLFRHHFPDSVLPELVLNISGLNFAVVATPTTLGIGVDMFLGADHPVYPMIGLPQYMYRNMKRDQMVPQAMKGWLQSMFEETLPQRTLLDAMIFHGKILYALDLLLPKLPDSAKVGFRKDEMEWCRTSEQQVWAHMLEKQLLYTTDLLVINKWVNQAPFISGIPKDSPGRLGHWVGWQIVRSYMRQHPNEPLLSLMLRTDSQALLAASKYKPSK